MTSRRGLAAVFLTAASFASAQVEVRPTAALPSAPRALAPLASSLLTPAPALIAAPPAAPPAAFPLPAAAAPLSAAAPSAAPLPPAQARALIMTGALAAFARTDMKSASAAETRGAGEALMLRALGGEASDPASVAAAPLDAPLPPLAAPAAPVARPSGRGVYLLSKPLRETVQLGPAAMLAHSAYALGWEAFKMWLGWKATGSPMGGLAVLAVELPFSPAMVTVRSLVDLGQRYWRRKLAVLRELARTPGVERVRVLTTGDVEFFGPLARRKDNTGLIFVESSSGLPETIGRFGAPIPIEDVEAQRVRLTLAAGEKSAAAVWTPPLSHLLEGKPLPPGIAAAWRAAISPGKAPMKILLDAAKSSSLRVDAVLVAPDGSEKPLGSIAAGPSVKTLIGLGRLDRVRAWLGRERRPRRLPVSDTVVERPGSARAPGWKAALRRAWRRLSGRLIVAPVQR
jgi:hypothetical protein